MGGEGDIGMNISGLVQSASNYGERAFICGLYNKISYGIYINLIGRYEINNNKIRINMKRAELLKYGDEIILKFYKDISYGSRYYLLILGIVGENINYIYWDPNKLLSKDVGVYKGLSVNDWMIKDVLE